MQQDISVNFGELLRFLLRGLVFALLVGGAFAFVAMQMSQREEPVFEAEAIVLAAQTNPEVRQLGVSTFSAPPLDVTAYREAALSTPVLQIAVERMGLQEPTAADLRRLRGRVSVAVEEARTSSNLYIRARGNSPQLAAQRANAVADAVVEWDRQRALEALNRRIDALEAQVEALNEQIRSLQTLSGAAVQDQIDGLISLRADQQQQLAYAGALRASATPLLQVLQPALPPTRQTSPRPVFDGVVAFLLGMFLSYALLLLRRALDTRIRDADDLSHVAGAPVLAQVPKVARDDHATMREASSYLRTNLLFSSAEAHPKVFLITSAQDAEGKTATATSLAEGFVRNGYRTLLVDADMRSPSVAEHYRISPVNRSSLTDWLREPLQRHQVVDVTIGPKQFLSVVPVFRSVGQASELLSRGFRAALERWRDDYDVIIVDSAPILAVADALTVAPFCTGTVLVVNQQRTDRRQVRTAAELLSRLGVRLLGVVATHVSRDSKRSVTYGYGYGETDATAKSLAPTGRGPRRGRS